MEDILTLKYIGDRAQVGEMDAYDVADVIVGFSDLTRLIGQTLYGQEVEVETTIRGLRKGSFEIEFLYRLLSGETAGLIASALGSPGDFLKLVKEIFDLIKHLKGAPPKAQYKLEGGQISVENNHGVVNQFRDVTVNITLDPKTGRSARNIVGKPLEKSAEEVQIISNEKVIASASRAEADSFRPVDASDVLTEHSSEVHLTIQTAVLEGKTRWKFSDGRNKFQAPIEDQVFLERVETGAERFAHGDELVVRLRSTQKRVNGQLRAEYAVERVLSHVSARRSQDRLL